MDLISIGAAEEIISLISTFHGKDAKKRVIERREAKDRWICGSKPLHFFNLVTNFVAIINYRGRNVIRGANSR